MLTFVLALTYALLLTLILDVAFAFVLAYILDVICSPSLLAPCHPAPCHARHWAMPLHHMALHRTFLYFLLLHFHSFVMLPHSQRRRSSSSSTSRCSLPCLPLLRRFLDLLLICCRSRADLALISCRPRTHLPLSCSCVTLCIAGALVPTRTHGIMYHSPSRIRAVSELLRGLCICRTRPRSLSPFQCPLQAATDALAQLVASSSATGQNQVAHSTM